MEITNTIKELDIELNTEWVKCHQDDIKNTEVLSYASQLNIQADRLATSAWETYRCHMAHIHYPSSQCTLYINGEAVNRAYRSYMRRAYSSHDAREYLMTKYKWDFATCEGIDWYSHGTAIKSLPYNQLRFVQRHIIDWLPLNNRLFERGRIPSNLCTLCDEGPETERHYLHCTKNKHSREILHEDLREVFNKHNIDPVLRKLIYQGLDTSIAEELTENGVDCELHDIPQEYESLVKAINNAGIYQLWYGRFPIEWDWYQRRYLQKLSEKDTEPTGEPKWIRAVTLTIWNHCYKRWITRCDHQYGKNQNTGFKHSQLLLQIQAMYSMQEQILSSEKYIFQTPIDDWKEKTTSQLEDWLTKYTPILRQSLRIAKKHSEQHTQDLRKFYKSTAQVPPTPALVKPQRLRKLKPPRRPLIQRTLKNQRVREQLSQPKPRKTKHTKNAPSTNILKNNIKMQPLSNFFPPKDTRSDHRKAKVRDRVHSDDTISGESNNIPE
jgi:hypothetical protein